MEKATLIEYEGHPSVFFAEVGEDELCWVASKDASGFGPELGDLMQALPCLKHYRVRNDAIYLVTEDGERRTHSPHPLTFANGVMGRS